MDRQRHRRAFSEPAGGAPVKSWEQSVIIRAVMNAAATAAQ
jgi:hypothetical protein